MGDETLDFFAFGHPLVEGVFAHFEDAAIGRVARLEIDGGEQPGEGLLAVYKEGPLIDFVAIDATGLSRRDWADLFRRRTVRPRRAREDASARERWSAIVRRLAPLLDTRRRPHALASLSVRPLNSPRTPSAAARRTSTRS